MGKTSIIKDDEHHIIIRRIEGSITVEEVIDGFRKILRMIEDGFPAVGIINDITDGNLDIPISQVHLLSAFLKKNIEVFKDIRIAAVVISPKSITIPVLVAKKVSKINIKAFSTNEAALDWILS